MVRADSIEKLSRAAENDLRTARTLFEETDGLNNIICFHIQQYVEKSIKVKLIQSGIKYNYSHDLTYLLGLFKNLSICKDLCIEINMLSSFAVDCRYDSVDIDDDEVTKAFDTAETIIELLKTI